MGVEGFVALANNIMKTSELKETIRELVRQTLNEGWKGYKPNMPVQVVGVKNGRITGDGGGVMVFKNLKDAQKVFPPPEGIDPDENTMQFTWVTKGEVKGRPAGRFETWRAYKMYSMEENAEKPIKERFNARILPANVEDLEMRTLHVLIGSAAEGLLQRVKKNTGSNSNPISLQIIKSLGKIRDAIKSKMDLKGTEALKAFFAVTNDHFDFSAPGISSLVKKYKLKTDKYGGNVIVKENNMETEHKTVDESFISSYEPAIPDEVDGPYGMKTRLKQREKDLKWWTELLNKTRKNSLMVTRAMQVEMAKKDIVALKKAIKNAPKNESTEELRELIRKTLGKYIPNGSKIEEGKSSKVVPLEKYGAAFTIMNGALMSVAMNRDGSLDAYDGELQWGEVTAPENQRFLDDINKIFKTKFKMGDFAGR